MEGLITMKKAIFKISFVIFILLILAACGSDNEKEEAAGKDDNEEGISTSEDEKDSSKETNESPEDNYEQYRDNVEPVNDEGDTEIWFKGESTRDDDEVVIFGQTNLLPGSELHVNPTGEASSFSGWDKATVEKDGTFYAENDIPSDFDDQLLQKITFTPEDQDDDIKDHYQPEKEKLEGPFTYLEEDTDDDELTKTAMVDLEFPEDQAQSTVKIEEPDWDKPDDYGSTEVWMEADIDKDDDYVYVEGESNLLEGTEIAATYKIPDKVQIGYNDFPTVNPDGSFEAEIKNPEKENDMDEYAVQLEVKPSNNDWPNVIEAYGENGEHFEGSLTEKQDDSTSIVKEIEVK